MFSFHLFYIINGTMKTNIYRHNRENLFSFGDLSNLHSIEPIQKQPLIRLVQLPARPQSSKRKEILTSDFATTYYMKRKYQSRILPKKELDSDFLQKRSSQTPTNDIMNSSAKGFSAVRQTPSSTLKQLSNNLQSRPSQPRLSTDPFKQQILSEDSSESPIKPAFFQPKIVKTRTTDFTTNESQTKGCPRSGKTAVNITEDFGLMDRLKGLEDNRNRFGFIGSNRHLPKGRIQDRYPRPVFARERHNSLYTYANAAHSRQQSPVKPVPISHLNRQIDSKIIKILKTFDKPIS